MTTSADFELAPSLEFITVQHADEITLVAQLAQRIWTEWYRHIISQAQIDYMLAHFQSETAIAEQLAAGYVYFLIRRQGRPVGYAAVQAQAAVCKLFISKLYLQQDTRQQGVGRVALQYLARWARQRGLSTLWLTVNKHNPALTAYRRMGFIQTAELVTDIGNGFVMDDYQMEWTPATDTYN